MYNTFYAIECKAVEIPGDDNVSFTFRWYENRFFSVLIFSSFYNLAVRTLQESLDRNIFMLTLKKRSDDLRSETYIEALFCKYLKRSPFTRTAISFPSDSNVLILRSL